MYPMIDNQDRIDARNREKEKLARAVYLVMGVVAILIAIGAVIEYWRVGLVLALTLVVLLWGFLGTGVGSLIALLVILGICDDQEEKKRKEAQAARDRETQARHEEMMAQLREQSEKNDRFNRVRRQAQGARRELENRCPPQNVWRRN